MQEEKENWHNWSSEQEPEWKSNLVEEEKAKNLILILIAPNFNIRPNCTICRLEDIYYIVHFSTMCKIFVAN